MKPTSKTWWLCYSALCENDPKSILCFNGNKNIWTFVQHGQCHKYAYSIGHLEWVQHLNATVSDIFAHPLVVPKLCCVVVCVCVCVCDMKEDSWFILSSSDRHFWNTALWSLETYVNLLFRISDSEHMANFQSLVISVNDASLCHNSF